MDDDTREVLRGEALERAFFDELDRAGATEEDRALIDVYLGDIKDYHKPTYEHLMRVGLNARVLGEFLGLDERILLVGGALHDIGKRVVPLHVLSKTGRFEESDIRAMRPHSESGYWMLVNHAPEYAFIAGAHHWFQPNPYGIERPDFIEDEWITYAKAIFAADQFDAATVRNDGFPRGDASFYFNNVMGAFDEPDIVLAIEDILRCAEHNTHVDTW